MRRIIRTIRSTPRKILQNLTCFYCGKKGHIERDCFKRKRDAEQGIVKPVSKNIEKQEQTDTAYGLITANKRKIDVEQSILKPVSKNLKKNRERP